MKDLILSDIELFFSQLVDMKTQLITVESEEANHIVNVMRHRIGDEIFITNGKGKIFKNEILAINKKKVVVRIKHVYNFEERFSSITFCIPILRNSERLEFALEKCVELGVTNFIIYYARRSTPKKLNQTRIEKILISAMKQSLLSCLPKVECIDSMREIGFLQGVKVVFEHRATNYFSKSIIKSGTNYFFIFGPEGGLVPDELELLDTSWKCKLAENRLRTETAIIKAAALL